MIYTPTNNDQLIAGCGHMQKRLSEYRRALSTETKRIKTDRIKAAFFGCIAAFGFLAETAILAAALGGLSFNVMGHSMSGIVFFGVVPMAFAYFHIRTHEYGDEGLRRLFSRIGRVGLIIMVLAASALIGISFVAGAFDSLIAANDAGGWSGQNGADQVQSEGAYSSWTGALSVFEGIPVLLFGIALCFSLVIAMNVVSWAVGRFLEPLNYIMKVEDRSVILADLEETANLIKTLLHFAREERKATSKWPSDINRFFAREYFTYVCQHITSMRTAAMLAFQTGRRFNFAPSQNDTGEIELIQNHFETFADASAHLDELQDHARPHNTLLILEANPGAPDPTQPNAAEGVILC